MRSRYSAYALCIMDYIIKTTHPSQQKAVRRELTSYNNDHVAWQKLTLIQTEKGKESDATGTVEFKAYYKEEGTEHIMHEVSRFSQIKQQWFYIHPNLPIQAEQQATVGRNDLCPCGSGRKYKKCCINS
ncbi:hypothetical protein CI610_01066 [invertebrate metagenome]|uniref:YchJ-like middle NTF2-like domain-containing protein n=1 Tax=invertebrate metagenome TaxID=1711999 RepID=A0A2H9T9M9_9ZZZZ